MEEVTDGEDDFRVNGSTSARLRKKSGILVNLVVRSAQSLFERISSTYEPNPYGPDYIIFDSILNPNYK